MGKIRILPEELVSKIAAGEVIERPYSVVKELVENSLDAGASHIEVRLQEGGKLLIRVQDDGEGMTPEDALLALEHHATSKLRDEEDLMKVVTFGFRGEALPSIARVSKLTLITRAEGSPGVKIVVEGGRLLESHPVGAPKGTIVEVKDLFYNLPARKKFLKSTQTELGYSVEAVVRLALAKPHVGFLLIHGDRELLHLPASSEGERIALLFGLSGEGKLLYLEKEAPPYRLRAWLSSPPYHRGNTKGIYFYVNDRYVKDRTLVQILSELYSDMIPRGSYPLAIVKLYLPPQEVDVNVHPTKAEVRFEAPENTYRFIKEALREALKPKGVFISTTQPQGGTATLFHAAQTEIPLEPIGQLDNTYILAKGPEGLMVFDQHALHERILYERLKGHGEGSQLTMPLVLELSEVEVSYLLENREVLTSFGFELEPFGPRSILIKALPTIVKPEGAKEVVEALLEGMKNPGDDLFEKVRKSLACQGAIKANMPLSLEEIRYLLEEWVSLSFPQTCPHGRPLLLVLSREELLRRFHR